MVGGRDAEELLGKKSFQGCTKQLLDLVNYSQFFRNLYSITSRFLQGEPNLSSSTDFIIYFNRNYRCNLEKKIYLQF